MENQNKCKTIFYRNFYETTIIFCLHLYASVNWTKINQIMQYVQPTRAVQTSKWTTVELRQPKFKLNMMKKNYFNFEA